MFSDRLPRDLTPNALTGAVERLRREGRSIIDLTVSNPTRAGFDYPPDLLEALADPRALEYRPSPLGSIAAREAVSRDYARQGVDVSPDRIVLTASTSEAYALLFKLLANAGDNVLVPRPSYPLFDHLTRLEMLEARPYDLEVPTWTIDVDAVEQACSDRTRAILIVNPNNPTGSYVSRGDADRLAAVCCERQLALIADEVFFDYALDPVAAAEAGRPSTRRDALTFSLGGLSKAAGLPQVKLGWIAVGGPAPLAAAALARLELICDSYLSVSTPAQVAAATLLDRGSMVRSQILERVRTNHQAIRVQVIRTPAVRVLCAEGGWYAVLQVPTLESEEDLVLGLLNDGVLTHPGYFFDFPRESFLVVSLLATPPSLQDGIGRILRHFDCRLL